MKVTSDKVRQFWDLVAASATDDCIEWPGYRNRLGYGECRDIRFTTHLAHRQSYIRFKGPLDSSSVIDHLCRNPACCNPRHLDAVSQRTNVLRGSGPTSSNHRKTHCPQGHAYTKANTGKTLFGGRFCKTCKSAYDRSRYLKRIST